MKSSKFFRLNLLIASTLMSLSIMVIASDITVRRADKTVTLTADTPFFGGGPNVILHDDFDSGKNGAPLTGWGVKTTDKSPPVYSNFTSVTGRFSGMSSFIGEVYNSTAEYKSLPNLASAYVSYYFRIQKLNGESSRNIKLLRLSGGHNSTYIQAAGITIFDDYKGGIFQQASIDNSTSKVPTVWLANYSDYEWHRAEYYIKLSNPAGASNGTTVLRIDGKTISNKTNLINEETGMRYKWVTSPFYVAHTPGGDYKIYYDNIVVSENRARVELCDTDIYTLCKTPVLASIEDWKANQIKISIDTSTATKPFIFVFDNDDKLLTPKGLRHCVECPKPPTPL